MRRTPLIFALLGAAAVAGCSSSSATQASNTPAPRVSTVAPASGTSQSPSVTTTPSAAPSSATPVASPVESQGRSVATLTDFVGTWSVDLPPNSRSAEETDLTINSDGSGLLYFHELHCLYATQSSDCNVRTYVHVVVRHGIAYISPGNPVEVIFNTRLGCIQGGGSPLVTVSQMQLTIQGTLTANGPHAPLAHHLAKRGSMAQFCNPV